MDPDACWAADDLLGWLARGGFEPSWTKGRRAGFYEWCERKLERGDRDDA